ncbi:hypothetical protein KTS45_14480 [Halomicroarcula limicola]|uniref:Uncharacterized protein n=1 Tax=Haloarcula limicola TaxID=1429915 RepID=A0A8J7Y635_9EURY|nr:hypothetical protein [Halomicroarcula limicola]MBV0925410.1 hypothetical protein [Halomicroarcula limicola]
MVCPHLDYRDSDGEQAFDHERPYCEIQAAFVSPMEADLCRDRHDFHHETHCAVYQRHHAADQLVPGLNLEDGD